MRATRKLSKKGWATIIAAALVLAIILTGTLSWLSISQQTINEFKRDKNPGGRIHDDFNGVENKDVYAENFTDEGFGAPVYVRIRLEEYMETGDEAGLNRDDPDRKAKPLIEGADINNTSTWFVHKPDSDEEGAVKDPFHKYWTWHMGGETTYMPTFNKNKDSLSVEVNGTYLGNNGIFDDLDPYSDYKTYTIGDDVTAWAYYDADPEDEDEYRGLPGEVPGGGGVEVTDETPDGNYTKEEETHTAQSTLAGLGVISMADWKTAGMPVCNKWVWDSDGWFYWPEPVQPQTATGLLLNKVVEKNSAGDKCYYAIHVKGQFVDGNPDAWGAPAQYQLDEDGQKVLDPSTGEPVVTAAATGFFLDGFSQDAQKLVAQAQSVKVVKDDETGEKTWYLPFGEDTNLYHVIQDDEGTLGALVCAGTDEVLGTEDDRTDVVYVAEEVKVGETPYGHYFLKPRTTDPYYEPYYLAMGTDKKLGTGDDPRLWIPDDSTFPEGVADTLADSIVITTTTGVAEVEVGKTLTFSAAVSLDGASVDEDVIWSVAPAVRTPLAEGTNINETTGLLTVADDEPNSQLVVTAALKRDDRNINTFTVDVYGKLNVKLTAEGDVTAIRAGETLRLNAKLYRGGEEAPTQPTFTWSVASKARTAIPLNTLTVEADEADSTTAVLTASRDITTDATVTVSCEECPTAATLDITIGDPATVTVTIDTSAGTEVVAGGTLNYSASIDLESELEEAGVNWKIGTSTDNGENIETVSGVTAIDGTISIPETYSIDTYGDKLWVKATAKAGTAAGASDKKELTVISPASIEISGNSKVKPGGSITLGATVKKEDGSEYGYNQVTWSMAAKDLSVTLKPGTQISPRTGKLSVASDEVLDTVLVVTATSKVKGDVICTKEIKVTDGTVTFDGKVYYVLYTDETNGRQLILAKYSQVVNYAFGSSDSATSWKNSEARNVLLTTWLEKQSELKAALWKDSDGKYAQIHTRTSVDAEDWFDSNDAVFLLSEADVGGTFNNSATDKPKDYTVVDSSGKGVKLDPPDGHWTAASYNSTAETSPWWLRSPFGYGVAFITANSDVATRNKPTSRFNLRPACWITFTPATPSS